MLSRINKYAWIILVIALALTTFFSSQANAGNLAGPEDTTLPASRVLDPIRQSDFPPLVNIIKILDKTGDFILQLYIYRPFPGAQKTAFARTGYGGKSAVGAGYGLVIGRSQLVQYLTSEKLSLSSPSCLFLRI